MSAVGVTFISDQFKFGIAIKLEPFVRIGRKHAAVFLVNTLAGASLPVSAGSVAFLQRSSVCGLFALIPPIRNRQACRDIPVAWMALGAVRRHVCLPGLIRHDVVGKEPIETPPCVENRENIVDAFDLIPMRTIQQAGPCTLDILFQNRLPIFESAPAVVWRVLKHLINSRIFRLRLINPARKLRIKETFISGFQQIDSWRPDLHFLGISQAGESGHQTNEDRDG